MELRAVVRSDIGRVRDHNEDAAHADPERRLFVVADGMGGHAAGEVASALAVESVVSAIAGNLERLRELAGGEAASNDALEILADAVREAHRAVSARSAERESERGMGTTLDVVWVSEHAAWLAHVGDGRVYRIRDGSAERLTSDHTLVEALRRRRNTDPETLNAPGLRSVLLNAVGASPELWVETHRVPLRSGDRLLLCSDGLHDHLSDDAELGRLAAAGTPDAALTALVAAANDRGGQDNITGILIEAA